MASLGGILNIASSGLLTAQTQLHRVSDNVSNVSTPGYIRKVADQEAVVQGGTGAGVAVTALKLATDRFLQAAGLSAASAGASAAAVSDTLDQAQALFGDPTGDTSFLGGLDDVFSGFTALAADSSTAARSAPLATLQTFLTQAQGLGANLGRLSGDVDEQISGKVSQANTLLHEIDQLNGQISRSAAAGGDVTGSQNAQSTLVDQLAQLVGVQVGAGAMGGVTLRASDGSVLVGTGFTPAVLSYDPSGPTGILSISTNGAAARSASQAVSSGALEGLVKLRNVELPGMADQLSSLTAGVADALNAAHNAHSAAPAPSSLTGRATALSQAEAFGGFTAGRTEVAVTDAAGSVTRRVDIDWAAGSLSVNGGAATSFSAATFASDLNTALGADGSASFSADGRLKLAATTGGVSVADDPAAPTSRAGKTFSGFLGLNDLVSSSQPSSYATGLKATDASGFTGDITLRISDGGGGRVVDVKVTAPAAPATMADLVNTLNAPVGGVGLYGAFALDGDGRLAFTPRAGLGDSLAVVADTTARGAGGPSLSAMFGIGEMTRAGRTGGFAVRADIAADSSRLALASLDTTKAAGGRALSEADAAGADALGQAGKGVQTFPAAGGLPGGALGVSDYAAKLAADVARRSADADTAKTSAAALATEAASRRASTEGVNLDQELVDLTTYQQAYNASARLVTTVRDMFDVLLNMI